MSHDRNVRLLNARRSLDGLSVGDAFGECFFSVAGDDDSWQMHLSTRTLPNVNWRWTDDTAMAVSIVESLEGSGRLDPDDLAQLFARRYAWDNGRGYGGTAHGILRAIGAGLHWSVVAPAVLGGMGSMGNGGAMRVAPIGAYFADDVKRLVEQAVISAQVTHSHPEGQAGAVAVALAAAFVAQHPHDAPSHAMLDFVLRHMPDSQTRAAVAIARDLPLTFGFETAASVLGNGGRMTAPDTVPFCLWCAARSLGDFEEAMWTTVSAGGDMDTNCAIVGGIVALSGSNGFPKEWIARREPLPPAMD